MILHSWRIISVMGVWWVWNYYCCNFFSEYIFGVPRCTVKYLFVVTSSVRGESCVRWVKTSDTCTLTVVRLHIVFFFLSLLCITLGPLHTAMTQLWIVGRYPQIPFTGSGHLTTKPLQQCTGVQEDPQTQAWPICCSPALGLDILPLGY